MSAYRFETVDVEQGVIDRWVRNFSTDEQAVDYLAHRDSLVDGEHVRAYRDGELGPFATFTPGGIGVEYL